LAKAQSVVSQDDAKTEAAPSLKSEDPGLYGEIKKPPEPEEEKTWEEFIVENDKAINQWVDGAADGLDLFLMGKRITTQKNDTHVRLQNSTYASDGQGIANANTLSVDLRLPNVEEYWLLKFSTYDENEEQRGIQNGYLRQTPQPTQYGAGVGLYHKLGDVRVAFQPRIDLSSPLNISHSLSFESVADFGKYRINPRLELFANPGKGVGVFTSLNFNFTLTKIYTLTLINYSEYDEKPMLYTVTNGFLVEQKVDKRSTLDYSLLFNSTSQPNYELAGYTFAVAWNQIIYRKVLSYQVIPHLDFLATNFYQGKSGLIVNFNFIF
jgi:hypothetical protein